MKLLTSGELGDVTFHEVMQNADTRYMEWNWTARRMRKMPDTICRRCGEEIASQSKYPECRQTIQEICPKCKYAPLEKFHLNCMIVSGISWSLNSQIQEAIVA
jgi:hypothetical protein